MSEQIAPVEPPVKESATSEVVDMATVEVPEFAPAVPEKKPEESKPEVAPVPLADKADEQVALQKRLNGALSDVEKKNEEVRKVVALQAELVQDNPDLIHKIAASDPILANKIVGKVWGDSGIRSYKQLLEKVNLESIKTTNPDLYETKSEMLRIKAQLEEQKTKEQSREKQSFLASKGILENEYDPKYIKLQAAMENLNPSIVRDNYGEALKMAHQIAFGGVAIAEALPELPKTPSIGGGRVPAPVPMVKTQYSDQSSWLAKSLEEKLGYKKVL